MYRTCGICKDPSGAHIKEDINMERPVTAAIAGLGNRGNDIYAHYQLVAPEEMKVVAVADPVAGKREAAREEYGVAPENCFETVEDLLKQPKLADILVIATQDKQHVAQAVEAIKKGYHILCEKPISPSLEECLLLQKTAHEYGRMVAVGHVLRYTPFYSKIKEVIESGQIGDVVSVQGLENVKYWHQAHSFVRGNWRDSVETSPMILAKCCHDMDIFVWLLGKKCERVSSYGSTYLFKESMAPDGCAMRCLDGCAAKENCPYDAEKIYITDKGTGIRNIVEKNLTGDDAWPCCVLSQTLTEEAIYDQIKTGPYGRCVYHCDNNVVDHQVVNMEFEGGVTVNFTMSAFTSGGGRDIRVMGTMGDIIGDLHTGIVKVTNFGKETEVYDINATAGDLSGHAGGDNRLIHDFLAAVEEGETKGQLRTGVDVSIQSHIIALAAEYSRIHEGESVALDEFIRSERYKEL